MSASPSPVPSDSISDEHNSAVLELDLQGRVRHASKECFALTGIPPHMMVGKPIAEFVCSADRYIFDHAAKEMRQSSFKGGSVTIWASLALPDVDAAGKLSFKTPESEVEAQGILVNVGQTGNEDDAVVWLIAKHMPRPAVSVQIPHKLASTTGFAIDVFAAFLEQLADSVRTQAPELALPPQELCRICERFVKSWWFERHHWLCAVEHKSENRIRMSLDSLSELRDYLQENWAVCNAPVPQPRPQSPAQHPASIKHAVHVSSPLARSVSPHSHTGQPSQTSPVQQHLVHLIEQCDTVLELDPALVLTNVRDLQHDNMYDPHNEAILADIKRWPKLIPPKDTEPITEETHRQIDSVVVQLTRFARFLRYRRILWSEVEAQVREAIEATIAAAESTDATVIIDQDSPSSSGSSDSGEPIVSRLIEDSPRSQSQNPIPFPDSYNRGSSTNIEKPSARAPSASPFPSGHSSTSIPQLDLNQESPSTRRYSSVIDDDAAVASEDEEELRMLMNLKRQRSSYSRRSSKEASANRSPHSSPHLSPKLWPATPSRRQSRSIHGLNSPLNTQAVIRRQSAASVLSGSAQVSDDASDVIPTQPSIRDYEILKPISRGAYGIVYLARKRITNDLFAIKVLRKSEMVAKNQVTHVKHERKVMISTATSPYVATLYYSFQSRDYLYLVMEYIPGGDVATLLKSLGCLTESWAKQYIAELIVAVDSLHTQGILHRDLKSDNLLIDSSGHLKLSDFGLSAIATNTKQVSSRSRTTSFTSSFSGNSQVAGGRHSLPGSPKPFEVPSPTSSENQSPLSSYATLPTTDSRTTSTGSIDFPQTARQKLLGTPDYLAPETIEGKSELTQAADWWSVGCIFFELVYGVPPFNDETPQLVFNNALTGKIHWPDLPEELDISHDAKKFIVDLLQHDPITRLGSRGSDEVMKHPFLRDIDWSHLYETQAEYVPKEEDPLATANFDDRGALGMKLPAQETDLIYSLGTSTSQSSQRPIGPDTSIGSVYSDISPIYHPMPKTRGLSNVSNKSGSPLSAPQSEPPNCISSSSSNSTFAAGTAPLSSSESLLLQHHRSLSRSRRGSRNSESSNDEFGNFTYRNLPVLEKANNDVITKIRDEDRRLSFSGSTSPVMTPYVPSSPIGSSSLLSIPQNSDIHGSDTRPASPVMFVAPPPAVPVPPVPQQPSHHPEPSPPSSSSGISGGPPAERNMSSSTSSSSLSMNANSTDGSERDTVLLRNRRRQLRRSMLLRSGGLTRTHLNVLTCGGDELPQILSKLDCKVVHCSSANEVCLKANSAMHFDLILLDIPPTSPLPDTEVVRIIRGTVNPNRETPILQVRRYETAAGPHLPSVDITSASDIKRVLQTYCHWTAPDFS